MTVNYRDRIRSQVERRYGGALRPREQGDDCIVAVKPMGADWKTIPTPILTMTKEEALERWPENKEEIVSLFDGEPLRQHEVEKNLTRGVVKDIRDRIEAAMTAKKITTFTMDDGWQNTNDWCHYYRTAKSLGFCTDEEYDQVESSMTADQWFRAFNG